MRKIIIGVMGPGPGAKDEDINNAFEVGRLVAKEGWALLTGGMASGVMDAASRGARSEGGLTVGILPTGDSSGMSVAVDIPIVTGMGSARNNINVLSSDLIIACGTGPGTVSEIALAIKAGKRVILLGGDEKGRTFFKSLSDEYVSIAGSPEGALGVAREIVGQKE